MKELTEPQAIVAKAECDIGVIAEIGKKIGTSYRHGMQLRRQMNAIGIGIGKQIIEACRDTQVISQLGVINAKSFAGGTPTRAHNFVAKELSKHFGYNADYLGQCARQYLAGLNKHCEQHKLAPVIYAKGGMLKCEIKDALPDIKIEPPAANTFEVPRMDQVFDEPETPKDPKLTGEALGLEIAADIIRRAKLDESIQPNVVRGIVKGLAPTLDKNGFAAGPKAQGGKFK